MNNWISVKNKLPPLDKIVLCYMRVNYPFKNNYIKPAYRYRELNCDIDEFSCEKGYDKVTHWQELPVPLKGE